MRRIPLDIGIVRPVAPVQFSAPRRSFRSNPPLSPLSKGGGHMEWKVSTFEKGGIEGDWEKASRQRCPGRSGDPATPVTGLRILTYNIHSCLGT